MLIRQRCEICSSITECKHSFDKWRDERHITNISLGTEMIDITNPEAILNGFSTSELDHSMISKTMNTTDEKVSFIKCNFCFNDVASQFLTQHIGKHIENRFIEETNIRVAGSTEITRYAAVKDILTEVNSEDVKRFLALIPVSKIKDIENFSFRKIKDISAFSGMSKNGRYSDFTLIVWFSESMSVYNGGYTGAGNCYYNKSSERLQIHLAYDSFEKYFTISGRAYKRTGYSDYDTEEGAVPDRICEQENLMTEIKKILLFFKISPKAVYKKFRKIAQKGYAFTDNTSNQTATVNHTGLLEELKNAKQYPVASEAYEYSMY